jgi:hypothetical protein
MVADSVSDFNSESLPPSAGVSLCFMISEDNCLNLSVDWARCSSNDNSDMLQKSGSTNGRIQPDPICPTM